MNSRTAARLLVLLLAIPAPAMGSLHAPLLHHPADRPSDKTGKGSAEAEALYQQALSEIDSQRPGRAQLALQRAVKLWCEANQKDQAARALLYVGSLHFTSDRFQDALQCFLRAEELRVLPRESRAKNFSRIAKIYSGFRFDSLAREYIERALRFASASGNREAKAEVLVNYAICLSQQGDFAKASQTLERARRLALLSGDEAVEFETFLQLGRFSRILQRYDKAEQDLELALTRAEQNGLISGKTAALLELGELSLERSRPEAAIGFGSDAERIAREGRYSEGLWRARFLLARALRSAGRTQDAARSYLLAIAGIEQQRTGYYSADDLKLAFLGEKLQVYREYVELLAELGNTGEALVFAERSKSRSTLDLLALRHERKNQSTLEAPSPEQSELVRKVTLLRMQLRELDPGSTQRTTIEAALREAEARLEESELKAQMSARRVFVRPIDIEGIQKGLLTAGDLLLEFSLGNHRSHVWLVSRDSTICVELPPRAVLEKVVADYVARLSQPPSNLYLDQDIRALRKRGAALFDLILGLVRDSLPVYKRLIIVPDGILSYLPFETLVSGGKYLVETHEISYAPSASVLRALMTPSAPSACSGERIDFLGVGNKTAGTVASRKPGFGTGKIAPSQWQFPPPDPASRVLIHAEDEVKSIARRFGASRSKVLLGPHASEPELQKEPLSCYRYIHFATHSHVDETIPSRSGLYLARGKGRAGSEFLGLDAISHLQLNSDLVVLSACQTGKGKRVEGEGIMGLARAFFMAGTRAEIASLWDLSDSSSPEFMDKFYKYLVAGEATVSALRHAKLTLISSRAAARHPFYWAPFMFFGSSH